MKTADSVTTHNSCSSGMSGRSFALDGSLPEGSFLDFDPSGGGWQDKSLPITCLPPPGRAGASPAEAGKFQISMYLPTRRKMASSLMCTHYTTSRDAIA
jgi:hypothetical protein